MNELAAFLSYLFEQRAKLLTQTVEHVGLTFASLLLAVLIGLPLGLLITRRQRWASAVLGFTGVLQTIPSIALLGFLIPVLGIGVRPAIFALFLYALLPIVRNTYTGVTGVDPVLKEAARGMGMTDWQLLRRVELPLALPVIFAGIRTATVINVGVATLAAYIAAGGLGEFIFGGIALNNPYMILTGALPAALLAILFDALLARLQRADLRRLGRASGVLLVGLPLLAFTYYVPQAVGTSLRAAFSPEFVGRADGLPNLQARYGLRIDNVIIAPGLSYQAVQDGQVDVIDGYSTDGRVKAYQLRVLTDDRRAFPPYYAAPVVRSATLRQHPDLADALNLLAEQIDDSTMTELNYRADELRQSPARIAQDFLQARGLLTPARAGTGGEVVIGSKNFTEQFILVQLYKLLIESRTDLRVVTRQGLGGTKICFDALRAAEIDLYPEYTGTGLQVILKADSATVSQLDGDPAAIYRHVDQRFRARYAVDWLAPHGFNNTYALMLREAQATRLRLRTISDLKRYLESDE